MACSPGEASDLRPTLAIAAATPTHPTSTRAAVATSTRTRQTATAVATGTPASTLTATPAPTPTPCGRPGEVISGSFPSATAGGDHAYRLYLPPCYGVDGYTYPTLYLFAGNIHNEGKWDELGIDEAADEAIATGEIPPLLIVMPAGGWLADKTSGGPGSYESLILNELIPHIEAARCAWAEPAGRAIGGISRGGYWALETAFRFPDHFVSVGGHSAALLDSFAGPEVNPQQTALNNDLGTLRIYLDIGGDDHVRTNTIRLHEDMVAAGVDHEWHLNDGRHDDVYWSGRVPEYLQWYGAAWPLDRASYPRCGD